jgi:UDP-galactopyranose mutase
MFKAKPIIKVNMPRFLVVGSGLSGAVIAENIARRLNHKVTIIEKRDHIGGNCYDYIDEETGILINKYGAHIFHTNNESVWDYINTFDRWIRWDHKVLSYADNKFVSIPVNITTINELCDQHLQNEKDVNTWLQMNQTQYTNITNSEEMAKSRVGEVLYEKLIKHYTFKQWNKYPSELDKSVLERIPVRPNFDTRYFSDKYQALPHKGYTHFFTKLLNHPNIEVLLNTDYFEHSKRNTYDVIIFTGPIDSYFPNLEKLEYRSIEFTIQRFNNMNFYQPNSVVNYPNKEVPYTRIVEYKHFLHQQSNHTIIVSEQTNDYGEPYYPVPNEKNLKLYQQYKSLAKKEEDKNIYFIGRLANYKYFNMDEAILNSLTFFTETLLPKFT